MAFFHPLLDNNQSGNNIYHYRCADNVVESKVIKMSICRDKYLKQNCIIPSSEYYMLDYVMPEPESNKIEYKHMKDNEAQRALIEDKVLFAFNRTVIGFLNSSGGNLYRKIF